MTSSRQYLQRHRHRTPGRGVGNAMPLRGYYSERLEHHSLHPLGAFCRQGWQTRQQSSHRGDGKFASVAGTYISLIEPNINPKTTDESRFGHVSHVPIGAMGSFQGPLRHVHTEDDRSVGRSCASENQSKHVSILPIGAMGSLQAWLWEVLRMSTHISSCVASDGA